MNSSTFYSCACYLRSMNKVGFILSGTKLTIPYNAAVLNKCMSPMLMSSLQSKFKEPSINIKNADQVNENKKHSQRAFEKVSKKKHVRSVPDPKDSDIQFGIFVNSAKSDPDSFGTLTEDWQLHQRLGMMPEEEGDVTETEFLNNQEGKRRLTLNQYAKMIKKFLKQKKLGLALEVLEKRMLKEDRARPEAYHYNLLITGCGQVGYVRKAFQLRKQMIGRGLKPTKHTYTSIFNACANSPAEFVEESLHRARGLRAYLQESAFPATPVLYHAMIKAFGRCGDVEHAFLLVDEMMEKKLGVSNETFNFLLQACISDQSAGFRHALLVYWKMRQKYIKPNLYTFNLLLRCSRDCELGDQEATWQVIQTILLSNQKKQNSQKQIEAAPVEKSSDSSIVPNEFKESTPNLISRNPSMGSIVAVKTVDKPEHRLMLMGGPRGVLEQMSFYKVKPDIKTFGQLLDQIPSTREAEQELLELLDESKVTLNTDLCNMLIRKRCFRNDFDGAKDVLTLMQTHNLKLNLFTYGVLALACRDWPSAQELLQALDNSGFRPNVQILGTMLRVARFEKDCKYAVEVMKTFRREEINPDDKIMDQLNMFRKEAMNYFAKEGTEYSDKLTRKDFREYMRVYCLWKPRTRLEEPVHPWEQFKEPVHEPEDLEVLNRGRTKYRP